MVKDIWKDKSNKINFNIIKMYREINRKVFWFFRNRRSKINKYFTFFLIWLDMIVKIVTISFFIAFLLAFPNFKPKILIFFLIADLSIMSYHVVKENWRTYKDEF